MNSVLSADQVRNTVQGIDLQVSTARPTASKRLLSRPPPNRLRTEKGGSLLGSYGTLGVECFHAHDPHHLGPDVAERLARTVRGGKGLKATVNEALRIALGMTERPVQPPPFKIGAFVDGLQPGINSDKMNQLLDDIEADDFARKHRG